MKLYRDDPSAHITMAGSPSLRRQLAETIDKAGITHVLESGTYHGLGSTRFIYESFPAHRQPEAFVTIEVNWRSWKKACRNLAPFPRVTPVWGRTVDCDTALQFINQDDIFDHLSRYPDVFIDELKEPRSFYRNEVMGALGGYPKNPFRFFSYLQDKKKSYAGENLLKKYLAEWQGKTPLIALDSSGGIGFLEFTVVEQSMRDHAYFLLLDDINHIKHFRSRSHIHGDKTFRIIEENISEGWLLAAHAPTR